MTNKTRQLLASLLWMAIGSAVAGTTDITQLPMSTQSATAAPNVIIGVDDSGSMDWEIMLNTNGGELWWDPDSKSFWGAGGVFNFEPKNSAGHSRLEYVYLFPNGLGSGGTQEIRRYGDGSGTSATSYFALAPIPAFGFMRSSTYNPLYYNPAVNYTPWADAYIAGRVVTFPAASATAARSHPYWPTNGSPTTHNLTGTLSSTSANWTFRMVQGMTVPGAVVSGITGKCASAGGSGAVACPAGNNGTWGAVTTDYVIGGKQVWDVNVPYYPATYWVVDATCSSGASCATAPDGAKLRRYEIKAGVTFPSGRSYADELQNFANWFTYYRKRKLMLAAAAGIVFSQVQGIRSGSVYFNAASTLSMYDFSSTDASVNAKAVLGNIYLSQANSGTPTRDVLHTIGQAFMTNKNVVQYACQRNSAFIVTDVLARARAEASVPLAGRRTASGAVPTYNQATWESRRPFQSIFGKTLADLSSAYYTVNLRPDLPTGQLSVDPSDTSPGADKNPNLHMTTYALTLGARGTIFGTGTPAATNPYLNYPTWPNPNLNYDPSAVDDLWHATINGRGQMFTTGNSTGLVKTLRAVVAAMLARSGSDASVAISNVNVRAGDNTVYVSSYNGTSWSGELAAYAIDPLTGAVDISPAARLWGARDPLTALLPTKRLIATNDGGSGVPFQYAGLSTAYKTALATPGVTPEDGADVLAFLRGDRSKEGSVYRTRGYLLGDIVSAQPVVVSGASGRYGDTGYGAFAEGVASRTRMVYQGANDGMLHAFDAATGAEVWAYVPALLQGKLNALSAIDYSHAFYVDGTPTAGDVDLGGGSWRTLLVGGLRAGGKGYYALDVTDPAAKKEGEVAAKVLWEFPGATTSTATRANVGLSFGRPVLAKTKAAGWVVLVTSGYNNTAGDGQGHLYVLDPKDGTVIKDLVTSAGSAANPSGLAQVAGYAANPQTDPTVDAVYGGDLQGNVWRFDLSGASVGAWGVSKLATLRDSTGTAQPITTTPELVLTKGKRLVIVGTGQLLGASDVATAQQQSMYAILDDGSGATIGDVRGALKAKTVTVGVGGIRNINSDAVDFGVDKGWYFDLPGAGERLNVDASVVYGALVFATNQPSPVACTAKSFLYAVDATNGGQMSSLGFQAGETVWAGRQIANVLANQPVLALLSNGKLMALTHAADASLISTRIPVSTSGELKTVAWKEVVR